MSVDLSMKVLALSGSLRGASVNSAMLRAAARVAPPSMELTVFHGLGDLPLFNPDGAEQPGAPVQRLFAAIERADAVIFASPEYAHGVTGVMKNALDWLVGFEPFAGKPVAVIKTSTRAKHADAALREILTTMAAQLIGPASLTIDLLGAHLDEDGMVQSAPVSATILQALMALRAGVIDRTSVSFSHSITPSPP
jgi:chromate reductase, NAD(P)H dehydrogenase (quinone)